MPPRKTVHIIVDVFEASKLDREKLEIYHDITYPLPPQCSLVLVDVINQDLGDQIAERISKRVGAAVEYRPISELDREEIGKHMISLCLEKMAVMLIDPSGKAVTFQTTPGHDAHSASILSQFHRESALMAYDVVKTIGLMRRNTPERAIIGAVQAMCELDTGSIAYLVNDMNREECFRQVFRAYCRPFGVAVSDCSSPISPAASSGGLSPNDCASSFTHSQGSNKRPRIASDGAQVSRPRSRSQGSVNCDWPGCKHPSPYTTKRGLSEHLTLKHNISKYDAEVKAKAAFDRSFQPPRHLVVPTPSFGPTQTTGRHIGGQTVQNDPLHGMAQWALSSPDIDSPSSVLSMSPMLGGGLDGIPSPGSHVSTNDARVNCPPSPGLEAMTRGLLLENIDSNHLSDGPEITFDETTSSFVQTHPRFADPWNQHNLYQIENDGDSASSSQVPVCGMLDNQSMSIDFTFRAGPQDTHFC